MQSITLPQQQKKGKPTIMLKEAKAYNDSQELPQFAWGQRWLRGDQYALILERMGEYCQKFDIKRYGANQHPFQIYQKPQNGMIYFLQGKKLETLGFPRIQSKKKYCWKKMNFPTLLPKGDPVVKYLVASSFISGQINSQAAPAFRMHVVLPLKFETSYLLCHIRQVTHDEQLHTEKQQEVKQLKDFTLNQTNHYRLFIYLHNHFSSS